MVMLAREQLFPYDIRFADEMERIAAARAKADAAPVNYARLGGAALARRGDMYAALHSAAQRARSDRSLQEAQRRAQWNEAAARKRALVMQQKTENIKNLATGLTGLGTQLVTEIAPTEFMADAYSGRLTPSSWKAPRRGVGHEPDKEPFFEFDWGDDSV